MPKLLLNACNKAEKEKSALLAIIAGASVYRGSLGQQQLSMEIDIE